MMFLDEKLEKDKWHYHVEKIGNGFLLDFESEGKSIETLCFKTLEDTQNAINDLFKKFTAKE